MALASLAFVMATLVPPGPGSTPAPPVLTSTATAVLMPEVCAAAEASDGQQRQPTGRNTVVTHDPHTFGVGGTLGSSFGASIGRVMSVGGSFRYWMGPHVGVDLKANWMRYNIGTNPSVAQVAPSVTYMLNGFQGGAIGIHPYAGAGPTYARLHGILTTTPTATISGTGFQEFGGAEITFRGMNRFAISAEVVHFGLPSAFTSSHVRSGTHLAVEFHYYLR